jgi:23S rRNA (cytidine1920-2'-O)/16S rRNA (cytidine1409-2'-O)-methyltransferase
MPESGPSSGPGPAYVGRGALKLRHALDTFGLEVGGWVCADFGANVGGFTDCLLRAGAARVYAVDTGYGVLAWALRNDPRVVVMERTNALHAEPPRDATAVPVFMDLIAIDLGWTPQRHAVPAALRWLRAGGRVVSLVKPHYEVKADERDLLQEGVLDEREAERIAQRTVEQLPAIGARVLGLTRSPILGGASKKKSHGNAEWLVLLERV